MKKYYNIKKSCSFNEMICNASKLTLKNIFDNLRIEGYNHYYFSVNSLESNAIKFLLEYKKKDENVKIFVVHNSEKPFWTVKGITNLPIKIENGKDEQTAYTNYLEKYCDKSV